MSRPPSHSLLSHLDFHNSSHRTRSACGQSKRPNSVPFENPFHSGALLILFGTFCNNSGNATATPTPPPPPGYLIVNRHPFYLSIMLSPPMTPFSLRSFGVVYHHVASYPGESITRIPFNRTFCAVHFIRPRKSTTSHADYSMSVGHDRERHPERLALATTTTTKQSRG